MLLTYVWLKYLAATNLVVNKILRMFPPAFHKWFLNTFSEPAAWFRACVAYAHTTAVWSMVGHIVGLGDQHGENILFDSNELLPYVELLNCLK